MSLCQRSFQLLWQQFCTTCTECLLYASSNLSFGLSSIHYQYQWYRIPVNQSLWPLVASLTRGIACWRPSKFASWPCLIRQVINTPGLPQRATWTRRDAHCGPRTLTDAHAAMKVKRHCMIRNVNRPRLTMEFFVLAVYGDIEQEAYYAWEVYLNWTSWGHPR
jgi:hypothetical protein